MTTYLAAPPDREFWKFQVCCQAACPVHTDARGYVRMIAQGRFEEAYRIARAPNPIASICGRICHAPCEGKCRRGRLDKPIAIRALKRFVTERFGPAAGEEYGKSALTWVMNMLGGDRAVGDASGGRALIDPNTKGNFKKANGNPIAIVGAGPAGLAAAHDLALMGFKQVVFEMEPVPAGMLSLGIPEYRLPRSVIEGEVDLIRNLGVDIRVNTKVGDDIGLDELIDVYDAVVLAVGAKKSRSMNIPGGDAAGIIGGVEFLRDVSLGKPPRIGRRVVIVGGGNVAMDSARTAVRIRREEAGEERPEHFVTVDATKAAISLGGRDIKVVYRRSEEEMPANYMEIYEAREENIRFHMLTDPVGFEKDERGGLRGVWCRRMELGEPDASGRRTPIPIEGSMFFIECDNVILSIGQAFALDFINEEKHGIRLGTGGAPLSNPETQETTRPGVYVAGDLAHGPKLAIHAVASGKRAAREIYRKFMGVPLTPEEVDLAIPLPDFQRDMDYEVRSRIHLRTLPPQERIEAINVEVEQSMTPGEAVREAGRCLDCRIQTIFDSNRCILCGGCVDICPMCCFKIIGAENLDLPDEFMGIREKLAGLEGGAAIIKNETVCIRCGLCASRCPSGAITMEQIDINEAPHGERSN